MDDQKRGAYVEMHTRMTDEEAGYYGPDLSRLVQVRVCGMCEGRIEDGEDVCLLCGSEVDGSEVAYVPADMPDLEGLDD